MLAAPTDMEEGMQLAEGSEGEDQPTLPGTMALPGGAGSVVVFGDWSGDESEEGGSEEGGFGVLWPMPAA